jgi:hypothetical protein
MRRPAGDALTDSRSLQQPAPPAVARSLGRTRRPDPIPGLPGTPDRGRSLSKNKTWSWSVGRARHTSAAQPRAARCPSPSSHTASADKTKKHANPCYLDMAIWAERELPEPTRARPEMDGRSLHGRRYQRVAHIHIRAGNTVYG